MDNFRNKVSANILPLMQLYPRRIFKGGAKNSGIMTARYQVLGQLIKLEPFSMPEISRHLYIWKLHLTALIDTLIEDRLAKLRSYPDDHGEINIIIAPRGKGYFQYVFEIFHSDVQNFISVLGYEDTCQTRMRKLWR